MNAFLIVLPIIFIRYGFLGMMNKEALKRAKFFAPLLEREKLAFWTYQITTVFILIHLLLLRLKTNSDWFFIGLIIYSFGIILYAVAMMNYAKPKANGLNLDGLYRISRNPMYVAYFICFLGGVLLTCSWVLLVLLIFFQVSTHWIILSEERWCIKKFGKEYIEYMNQVKRYI